MDDSEPEEIELIVVFGKMEDFINFFPLDPSHNK